MKEQFNDGDTVYISVWRDIPGRPNDSVYYDSQSLAALMRKRFWAEIRPFIDVTKTRCLWKFTLKDGSSLAVMARPYSEELSSVGPDIVQTVENPVSQAVYAIDLSQSVNEEDTDGHAMTDSAKDETVGDDKQTDNITKRDDYKASDDGTKSVILDRNKLSSLIHGYAKFSINTRAVCGKVPTSLKREDGQVVYAKTISDSSVPFNYLLNSPSANAVRKVIVFNDSERKPFKTIVLFDNGDRVVVRRNGNDAPDVKMSVLWAIVKHSFGNSVDRQIEKILDCVAVDSEEQSRKSRKDRETVRNKAKSDRMRPING